MTELEREYRCYLRSVARVPVEPHDRYVGWVWGFLRRPGAADDARDASQRPAAIEEYSRFLGRGEPPSTVAAALNAIRHFWYFLDRRDGGAGAGSAPRRPGSQERAVPAGRERDAAVGSTAGQPARDALIAPVIRAVRESLRLQHKSCRTEQTYLSWIDRFPRHCAPAEPADLGAEHVRRFLSWLEVESRVSASAQSQAWNALLFLFRFVLDRQIDGLAETIRAPRRPRIPVVMTVEEVKVVLAGLTDPYRLMCEHIYAGGLRMEECLSLRVMDLEDGNKRVALASALVFLDLNGVTIADPGSRLYPLMIAVASGRAQKPEIAAVLRELASHRSRPGAHAGSMR